eukprot:1100331-Alexandrium_andersonii.AAC.1
MAGHVCLHQGVSVGGGVDVGRGPCLHGLPNHDEKIRKRVCGKRPCQRIVGLGELVPDLGRQGIDLAGLRR